MVRCSTTSNIDRQKFFNVEEPFTLPKEEFENKWKEVSNIWVQFGGTKTLKRDPEGWTKTYYCRFKKQRDNYSRASSSKEPSPSEKKRKTSKYDSELCEAQITITLKQGAVTVRKTHPDGPNHTHDINASDIRKTPSAIVGFVETEATKGYRATAIRDAAMKEFEEKAVGVEFMKTKQVHNLQRKVHGGLDVPFIGENSVSADLKSTMEWLSSNDYMIEGFTSAAYQGFAFATEANLQVLRKSGVLAIMDSTHKTNKHNWKLYTLIMRNTFGSWLPGGHFIVSSEEQHIVSKAFKFSSDGQVRGSQDISSLINQPLRKTQSTMPSPVSTRENRT